MIGVTGASGHLGQALMDLIPDAYPIGRTMPDIELTGLIHAAAPNYRDDSTVIQFEEFNQEIQKYLTESKLQRIVIVGSWWQISEGNCREVLYTKLKERQTRMFSAVHIIPYSIYGDGARVGRGIIPQIIQSIKTGEPLIGLSKEPRDFIHVKDVAAACLVALDSPRGVYMAGWGKSSSPLDIAARYGLKVPEFVGYPDAELVYPLERLPEWEPKIRLHEHIHNALLGR
jgi:nucleoside-diphosphate-sugar epimerase